MTSPHPDAALIERLLELPPLEREKYLSQACANNLPLRARLDRIAQALARASDPVEKRSPVPVSASDRARAMGLAIAAQETASMIIGPYKLLQKIGEGGFGTVWMAEQQEPVRRMVALKVIKSGMDTREVIARFEAERQALALMDHPNIARVFDAGETDQGRPYFVMELVRGIPITKYCDENRLPTAARLHLFIAVCQAVQHAHQKGIIHRDLKPSNILVTLHDGIPRPKIIDFGIAKATGVRLTDKTLFTQFHAFIGTPAYTSPEQMEMSGLDVDTRSDIYSLGILLYELLAGRPPFDPETLLKSGLEEMRRTIREVEPLRPSHRLRTSSGEIRAAVARQRSTDATKLTLLLCGDLDWIVMRCLEKDRVRRYDTANSLVADVRNYLNDEPVSARQPTARYRLHKFIRRHKVQFVTGTAIGISLIAGLVASSVLFVRERAARKRAVAAETTETGLRKNSTEVARFMTDMLNGVGPSVALGRDTKLLRDILDATAHRLDTDLRNQPAVTADLRDTLGKAYYDLGEYKTAEPLLLDAVAAHRLLTGNESAATATSLYQLGITRRALNKSAEAETELKETLAIRRKLFGSEHPLVADALYQLVWVPNPRQSLSDRETVLKEALAIRRKTFGESHASVAEAIAGLGVIAAWQLDYDGAIRLHTEALAIRRRLLGDLHPDVAASLDAIGYCCTRLLNRSKDAAAAYAEAFAIRRPILGDQHPETLISLLRLTGQMTAPTADSESLAMVRGFVASQRKLLPRGSALLAPSLLALASLEGGSNRTTDEARVLVREAHTLLEPTETSAFPLSAEVVDAMFVFALSKNLDNAPGEGLAMAEEALVLSKVVLTTDRRDEVFRAHSLGWLYWGTHRYPQAITQFEISVSMGRTQLEENNPIRLADLAALGACYRAVDRIAESHTLLKEALRSHETRTDDDNPNIACVMCQYGLTLIREARFAEAEAVLRRSLANYDRPEIQTLLTRFHPRPRAETGLGRALAGQGRFAEAEPFVVHALAELKENKRQVSGDRAGMMREALEAIIEVNEAWAKPDKVAEWRQQLAALSSAPL